jgi:hypothetical protein
LKLAEDDDRVYWYQIVRQYLDDHDIAWTA